ncbi:MAG: Clp protease ClpP [Spirochaetes bacterium]|nr:Clp protease ClpP [Spirochaetota bacterium]
MAKKIRISGYIGFDTTAAGISQQLTDAGGEDIDVIVASAGGDVYEGIAIFNAIRDYHRRNPSAQIYLVVSGVAASMASHISMVTAYVGGLSAAEDNSVMFIHNAWNMAMGDYHEMQKNAEFLKGLTDLMAKAYIKKSGKSAKEIAAVMDAETFYFGQQIKDAGFVDEIVPSSDDAQPKEAAAAISAARLAVGAMQAKMRERAEAFDANKAAAVLRPAADDDPQSTQEPKNNLNTPAVGGKESTPERGTRGKVVKDLKELQTEHPEIYAQAVDAGVKKEQERVAALSAMKKDPRYAKYPGVVAVLDECIAKPGKTVADANPLIVAVLTSNGAQAAAESPEDLAIDGVNTATGEKPKGAAGKEEKPEWKPGGMEEV